MKIMTFNLKHKILEDIFGLWKKRYREILKYLKKENPDILGVQELTRKGKHFLKKELKDYQIIGKRRHSIILTNEYNCLLIKKDYKIISHNTYSLSNKITHLGTKTKNDKFPRICVVAHIEKDDIKYMIVNTHLDNSDKNNKKRLLKIYNKIVETHKNDDEYLILLGDYNMTIDNKNLKEFAVNYKDPFENNKKSSFTGFPNIKSIDHIFLDKRLNYKNEKIDVNSNDESYLSDHYPLSCIIDIEKK